MSKVVWLIKKRQNHKLVKTIYLHIEYPYSHSAQVVIITSFRQRHIKQTIWRHNSIATSVNFFPQTLGKTEQKGGKHTHSSHLLLPAKPCSRNVAMPLTFKKINAQANYLNTNTKQFFQFLQTTGNILFSLQH